MNKRETFQSPFREFAEYIGQPFEIIGEAQIHDEEVGKTYPIKFPDGKTIDAYPEEVLTIEAQGKD